MEKFKLSYFEVPVFASENSNSNYTANIIQQVVCDFFKIKLEEMAAKERDMRIREPRQIMMWLLVRKTKMTTKKIGKLFNRDHATVLHSCKRINDFIHMGDHTGKIAQMLLSKI